jgi:uroporphyrinogen-III synthase
MSKPPLAGIGVVVTRDEPVDGPLATRLARAGARVLRWPATATAEPDDPAPLAAALAALPEFDWLVVTSARAVEAVARRVDRLPPSLRVAAVGEATAAAARAAGWRVDRVPREFSGEALVAVFRAAGDAHGAKVLFPAADRAAATVPDGLAALGAEVDRVEAYRTVPAPLDPDRCLASAAGGEAEVLTFTSPSAVDGLARALGDEIFAHFVERLAVVVLGSTTAAALARRGLAADAVAEPSTLDGLVAAAGRAVRTGLRRTS